MKKYKVTFWYAGNIEQRTIEAHDMKELLYLFNMKYLDTDITKIELIEA